MAGHVVKTTIDKAGRVVIPAPIRRRAGLGAGVELDVQVDGEGLVRLMKTVPRPEIVHRRGRLVAQARVAAKQLSGVDVAALVEEERSRWPPGPPSS